MASPYTAGLAAALICDANRRYPGIPVRSSWVRWALQGSGSPVPGYTVLDYGPGIPDLVRAAELLDERMAAAADDDPLLDYEITTESPLAVGGEAPAAYWRTPYFPADQPQVFTIEPLYVRVADANQIAGFVRRFTLHSDQPWCRPRQEQVYVRSEMSARVHVDYQADLLTEPGLYVAVIEARAEEIGQVEFRLLNTVVVPYRFDAGNDYHIRLRDQKVEGWKVRHYFLSVPAGASALQMTIEAVEAEPSTARAGYLFAPNGREHNDGGFRLDTRENLRRATWSFDELTPGVWELCVSSARPDEVSYYDLDLRFVGVVAEPAAIDDWSHAAGGLPNGTLTLTNLFSLPIPISCSGRIEGYRKTSTHELSSDEDEATTSLKLNPQMRAVRVHVEFSKEDFGKFTDVAVNIFDESGQGIVRDGMSMRTLTLSANNPDPAAESTTVELVVQAAFADPDGDDEVTLQQRVDFLYADSPRVEIERDDSGRFTLYPGVPTKLSFTVQDSVPQPPEGTNTVGYLRFDDAGAGQTVIEVPIEVAD
jgi:hypothetical protein